MHKGEVWVGVNEISCLSEELAIRLLLPDPAGQEWVENGGDRGDGGWITMLKLKISIFPVEKLRVTNNFHQQILFIIFTLLRLCLLFYSSQWVIIMC